ncbi:hypothetical protein KUTeg_015934, partial [Tegillarca granosa]
MAGADAEGSFYIELCKNPIRFDPVDKVTGVFYDDANKQVFAVRSQGAMGVVVKGPEEGNTISFRMESRGDVVSIKFSPDRKILGVQRSSKSVGKSTRINGFVWVSSTEIAFITDHGLEFYQANKRTLKCIKTINLTVNWFVWLAESSMLLLATGGLSNTLNPFVFKPGLGTVIKLPKFEVDLQSISKQSKLALLERDVIIAKMDSPARKTDVLRLDMSGRFAINIIDNLVVVHHQASRTSMIFDIQLEGESDGFCRLVKFLLLRQDSKPVILKVCSNMLLPGHQATLFVIAQVFDMLNKVYQAQIETEMQTLVESKTDVYKRRVIIDQSDMYTHVFSVFEDNKDIKYKFMVAVLIEYIRSLSHFTIPVQHYLYELIINILVHNNCFYQLHQFLQYHVLSDSKPVGLFNVVSRKCLPSSSSACTGHVKEAAMNTEDNMLYYTVYKFFEQRNQKLRGNPKFQPGELGTWLKQFE